MPRRRLADLVREEVPDADRPAVDRSTALGVAGKTPKYLTLLRKDVRLREDQILQLTRLARRLTRAKRGGERITENTLIRVAVDLLLSQGEDLAGESEEELRRSVGRPSVDGLK